MDELELVAEGKTKKIYGLEGMSGVVLIESKDDITAGDGARHDVIPGKGVWATETNNNVFRFLKSCGIPVAWIGPVFAKETEFLAKKCDMVPLEVVVRRRAYGSYLQRNPGFAKGAVFPAPFVELFLKTTDKRFGSRGFSQDDPMIRTSWEGKRILLCGAHSPRQTVLGEIEPAELGSGWERRMDIRHWALSAFHLLEQQWDSLGCTLCDLKVEFGFAGGELLIADVIDNDSWRLFQGERQLDKQVYRDGADLSYVAKCYERVADLSGRLNTDAHGDTF